jgi:hypothetical protein
LLGSNSVGMMHATSSAPISVPHLRHRTNRGSMSLMVSSPTAPSLLWPRLQTACLVICAVGRGGAMPKGNADFDTTQPLWFTSRRICSVVGTSGTLRFGQHGEHLRGTSEMCGSEVAFGAAVSRRFGQGGLLARLRPGRRDVGRRAATTGQLLRRRRKARHGGAGRAWKEGDA